MNSKEIIKQAEKALAKEFEQIDEIRDYNQEKVLKAFIENKVAPEHFYTVSGYGHDDLGREVLDRVFADVFKAEKHLSEYILHQAPIHLPAVCSATCDQAIN